MGGRARHRKPAVIGVGAMAAIAAIVAGFTAFGGTDSQAAESCAGLDKALQNNLNFIAGQQANPDAQSEGRIANRQAVVDLLQKRRADAGCNGDVKAESPLAGEGKSGEDCAGLDKALQNNLNFIAGQKANPDAQSEGRIANREAVVDLIEKRRAAAGCDGEVEAEEPAQEQEDPAQEEDQAAEEGDAADDNAANAGGAGEVVCEGQNVTLSGEAGAPAASSNQFPAGTKLKVTNLDNDKSTTVEVSGVSGSCALLNNAAFEQVREPGKFLIRNAKIERVG